MGRLENSVGFPRQETDRKRRGITLVACGGRKLRYAAMASAWHNMSAEAQSACAAEARASWVGKALCDECPPPVTSGSSFWNFGDCESPFTEQSLIETVVTALGSMPGASRYLPHFRDEIRKLAFVTDGGDIKKNDRYRLPIPCWKSHPDFCCNSVSEEVLKVITTVNSVVLSNVSVQGSFYKFEGKFVDESVKTCYALLALIRKKQRVLVWIDCSFADGCLSLLIVDSKLVLRSGHCLLKDPGRV